MPQSPSVGRVVHYQSYGTPGGEFTPQPRAAIVTQVADDGETVGLFIMNPTGVFLPTAVKHAADDAPTPGMWNWPPYIGPKLSAQPVQQQTSALLASQIGVGQSDQLAGAMVAAGLIGQQGAAASATANPPAGPDVATPDAPPVDACPKCAGAGCQICD